MTPAKVDRADLGRMLIGALRYAMGRRSYVTGETADLVRRYWWDVSEADRRTMRRDLGVELAFVGTGTLGAKMDHDGWVALRDWMARAEAVPDDPGPRYPWPAGIGEGRP